MPLTTLITDEESPHIPYVDAQEINKITDPSTPLLSDNPPSTTHKSTAKAVDGTASILLLASLFGIYSEVNSYGEDKLNPATAQNTTHDLIGIGAYSGTALLSVLVMGLENTTMRFKPSNAIHAVKNAVTNCLSSLFHYSNPIPGASTATNTSSNLTTPTL